MTRTESSWSMTVAKVLFWTGAVISYAIVIGGCYYVALQVLRRLQ